MTKKSIVVIGDVVTDHHHYEAERSRSNTDSRPSIRAVQQEGGAAMLRDLIDALINEGSRRAHLRQLDALVAKATREARERSAIGDAAAPQPDSTWEDGWDVKPGKSTPSATMIYEGVHAYGVWRPFSQPRNEPGRKNKSRGDAGKVWRLENRLGYGDHKDSDKPVLLHPPTTSCDTGVLVLDDADLGFRNEEHRKHWFLPEDATSGPAWILLKMSGAVARGDLWQRLIKDFSTRLICLISAEDLRRDEILLGRGLSWERTVEEIGLALSHADELQSLSLCAHVVITFSADGALWIDRTRNPPVATLIFDAAGADGAFVTHYDGGMIGFQTAMTASLAQAVARHVEECSPALDFREAIGRGLAAKRNLMEFGHGPAADPKPDGKRDYPPGYPIPRLTETLLTITDGFAVADVSGPLFDTNSSYERGRWMMVEMLTTARNTRRRPSLFGVGCDILLRGGDVALKYFPHARFGKLVTVDRGEIEALRNIRRLLTDYMKDKDPAMSRPLSIGVFGPPGAGKSFGVKQIADEIADELYGESSWLEFNLSQFTPPADLIGALHQVRGRVLSGRIPVVFWDEFDSRKFEWLQYLLAPMQDGRFQDGQVNHPLGRCVFIFAGGTSASYEAFSALGTAEDANARDFVQSKGPDFRSRIDAYYDVLGPNQRLLSIRKSWTPRVDPSDGCFVLRRALLIQSVLKSNGALKGFDKGLMNALLRIDRYKNGSRSLEKIVAPLLAGGIDPVRRSYLPAPSQIAMHVSRVDRFLKLLTEHSYIDLFVGDAGSPPNAKATGHLDIDTLASAVHATWRALPKTSKSDYDMDFKQLDAATQDDNRAAARRIPWILALAGLDLEKLPAVSSETFVPDPDVTAQLTMHIERLAEFEHDGWMEHRKAAGWRLGPRDNNTRHHPCLIPYGALPEDEKQKDRNTINQLPRMVDAGGYRIIWLKDDPAV